MKSVLSGALSRRDGARRAAAPVAGEATSSSVVESWRRRSKQQQQPRDDEGSRVADVEAARGASGGAAPAMTPPRRAVKAGQRGKERNGTHASEPGEQRHQRQPSAGRALRSLILRRTSETRPPPRHEQPLTGDEAEAAAPAPSPASASAPAPVPAPASTSTSTTRSLSGLPGSSPLLMPSSSPSTKTQFWEVGRGASIFAAQPGDRADRPDVPSSSPPPLLWPLPRPRPWVDEAASTEARKAMPAPAAAKLPASRGSSAAGSTPAAASRSSMSSRGSRSSSAAMPGEGQPHQAGGWGAYADPPTVAGPASQPAQCAPYPHRRGHDADASSPWPSNHGGHDGDSGSQSATRLRSWLFPAAAKSSRNPTSSGSNAGAGAGAAGAAGGEDCHCWKAAGRDVVGASWDRSFDLPHPSGDERPMLQPRPLLHPLLDRPSNHDHRGRRDHHDHHDHHDPSPSPPSLPLAAAAAPSSHPPLTHVLPRGSAEADQNYYHRNPPHHPGHPRHRQSHDGDEDDDGDDEDEDDEEQHQHHPPRAHAQHRWRPPPQSPPQQPPHHPRHPSAPSYARSRPPTAESPPTTGSSSRTFGPRDHRCGGNDRTRLGSGRLPSDHHGQVQHRVRLEPLAWPTPPSSPTAFFADRRGSADRASPRDAAPLVGGSTPSYTDGPHSHHLYHSEGGGAVQRPSSAAAAFSPAGSPRSALRYRQLEAELANPPSRPPSAFPVHRLYPKGEGLEQSPSRNRPSVIPTDIHDPHPFGVWVSERRGPTSLPPPPRSLPGSLSRRRGEQLSRSSSQATTTPITPIRSRFDELALVEARADDKRNAGSQEPEAKRSFSTFQASGDRQDPPAPSDAPVSYPHRSTPPFIPRLGYAEAAQFHHRSRSDQSAVSWATEGRASDRTTGSSQLGAGAILPSLSSYASGGSSASVAFGSRSPSTAITTPSLSASSRIKHSHRSSGGGSSSRQHSFISILGIAPPLAAIESLSPHREEPSFSSRSSPTVTGVPSRGDDSARSSSLKTKASTLSSLLRLGRSDRRERSDNSAAAVETGQTAASATTDERSFRWDSAGTSQGPIQTHSTLETATGGRGDRSHGLFRGTASLRLRKSFARLAPRFRDRTGRGVVTTQSISSEHLANPKSDPSDRTAAFEPHPASVRPLTGDAAEPPAPYKRSLPNLTSLSDQKPAQRALRVQDVLTAGFPFLLPITPGSEAGLSSGSELHAAASSGPRPAAGYMDHRPAAAETATTFSTIKRKGGERIATVVREGLGSAEPTDPGSDGRSADPTPGQAPQLSTGQRESDRIQAMTATPHGPPRSSFDDYLAALPPSERPDEAGMAAAVADAVAFPTRSRTDSRLSASPRAAMLVAAAANVGNLPRPDLSDRPSMPAAEASLPAGPQVGGDSIEQSITANSSRQSVRRGLGMRAESESAYTMASSRLQSATSKHQQGRSKDDTDGLAEERRADVLRNKQSRGSSIASSIRRLIRRSSLRSKSNPTAMSPPTYFKRLLSEVDADGASASAESGAAPGDDGRARRDSLPRSKSKDGKASSIFAPFRTRDGPASNKARARTSTGSGFGGSFPSHAWKKDRPFDGDESFGNSGPLEPIAGLPKPSRDLPYSFRAAHNVETATNRTTSPVSERLSSRFATPQAQTATTESPSQRDPTGDTAPHIAARSTGSDSVKPPSPNESTPKQVAMELEVAGVGRPLSDATFATDEGVGLALGGRTAADLTESLAMNGESRRRGSLWASGSGSTSASSPADPWRVPTGASLPAPAPGLAASGRQLSEPLGAEAARSGRGALQSPGGTAASDDSAPPTRPQMGIPRIWQGIETVESPIASAGPDEGRSPRFPSGSSEERTASRFGTVTTVGSFKTAASSPSSLGRSSAFTRPAVAPATEAGSQSPRPTDADRGKIESLLSGPAVSVDGRSTAVSAAYYDTGAESIESLAAHLTRPAIAAGPSPDPDAASFTSALAGLTPSTSNVGASASDPSTTDGGDELDVQRSPVEAAAAAAAADDRRRNTFGELDRILARQVGQKRRVSSQLSADDSTLSLQDLDVSEIETHLAAVEAALQGQLVDASTVSAATVRESADDEPGPVLQGGPDFSMVAEDGSFSHDRGGSDGDISMPGAWNSGVANRPFPSGEEGRLLALAPASQQAIADAVQQVRRAISSSQLSGHNVSMTETEARFSNSDDGEASRDERDDDEARDRLAQLGGDAKVRPEFTPLRAAKRRRDSMRDIEESYGRMLALVQSSAIGVTPSPTMKNDTGHFGDHTPHRRSKRDSLSQSMQQAQLESPLSRTTVQAAERRERVKGAPIGQQQPQQPQKPRQQTQQATAPSLPPTRALGARFMGIRSRGPSRLHSGGDEMPASTSLSGLMGMPRDEAAWHLRGRTSTSSIGSMRRVASESPVRLPRIDSPSLIAERENKRHSAGAQPSDTHRQAQILAQSKERMPAQSVTAKAAASGESDQQWRRYSNEQTVIGRASSGATGTSPSATNKTQGTPRSQPAEPAPSLSRLEHGTWDEAAALSCPRSSYPGATDTGKLAQDGEAPPERERYGEGHSAVNAGGYGGFDGFGRFSAALHGQSPTFESRLSSLSQHTGDASRSTDGHGRRRSRPTHQATHSTASSRPFDVLSPSNSLASGILGRYEIGSIRDWSSQVSYRPASSRSSAAQPPPLAPLPQREDGSSTMGASEYDALAALGVVPPSSSSHASIATLMRRHELERESLLDSLERTRAEVAELRTRNESLTADLHAEVTRVLELERELERRDDRELQLLARTQQLEEKVARLSTWSQDSSGGDGGGGGSGVADTVSQRGDNNSDSKSAGDQTTSARNSQAYNGSEHSQAGGPHKVSSFGGRPGHRSTMSETVLPGPKNPVALSRQNVANSPTLPLQRPRIAERARPVSLFSGSGGLTRTSSALPGHGPADEPSTARAAAGGDNPTPLKTDASGETGQKPSSNSPKLRQYPSLLGLNLHGDEAEWALVDEEPPEEASRDSFDESRGDLSSFLANYVDTTQSRSIEFPLMSSPKRNAASGSVRRSPSPPPPLPPLPPAQQQHQRRTTASPPDAGRSGVDASAEPVAGPSQLPRVRTSTQSSMASERASPRRASSIVRSPPQGVRGHRRVPGSLGIPSMSSLPRLAGSVTSAAQSPSHRTASTSSSVRSTSSRLQQPGNLSGIPFSGGGGMRHASSATAKSNYTHASTYTARSDSPVGSFVSNWRTLDGPFSPERRGAGVSRAAGSADGGATTGAAAAVTGTTGRGEGKKSWIASYYDPRRPGDYDPHSLSATHEALLDTSFSSVDLDEETQRTAASETIKKGLLGRKDGGRW
ncbi:hypothetical protein ACQY0O_004181 [Thecaphora frezii]